MSARIPLALLALTLMACGSSEPHLTTEGWAWVPLHPRTQEPAVAALVLHHGMGLPGESVAEDHPVAIALWADGSLIMSAGGGGAYGHPYRAANLGAGACENIRSSIQRIMLEREGKRGSFGIADSDSEELLVREGDRVWRMQSCIDLFESNPGVIAFSGGVAARDGMPQLDPNDPEERALQEFREAWTRAKQSLLTAIPGANTDLDAPRLEFAALGSRAP